MGFGERGWFAPTAPKRKLKSGVDDRLHGTPDFKFVCGAVVARHRRLAKPITLYGVLEIPPSQLPKQYGRSAAVQMPALPVPPTSPSPHAVISQQTVTQPARLDP